MCAVIREAVYWCTSNNHLVFIWAHSERSGASGEKSLLSQILFLTCPHCLLVSVFSSRLLELPGFPGSTNGREPTCQRRRQETWVPSLGRSPAGGNGNPLQYSCLENPMDREEPGGLQSMGSQRMGHDWRDLAGIGTSLPETAWINDPRQRVSSLVKTDLQLPYSGSLCNLVPATLYLLFLIWWGSCSACM